MTWCMSDNNIWTLKVMKNPLHRLHRKTIKISRKVQSRKRIVRKAKNLQMESKYLVMMAFEDEIQLETKNRRQFNRKNFLFQNESQKICK